MFDFVCFLCLFDTANITLFFICQAKNKKNFMLYVVKNQRFIKKVKKFFIRAPKIPHFFTPKQRQPQNFQFPAIQINIILSLLYILLLYLIYTFIICIYSLYITVYSFTLLLLVYSSSYYYLICLLSYMFTIFLFYFLMYMIVYI